MKFFEGRKYRNYTIVLWVAIMCILFPYKHSYAQVKGTLKGRVLDVKTNLPIAGLHVVSKKSERGTISQEQGFFSIQTEVGDTLVFSHLSYRFLIMPVREEAFTTELLVEMQERNYLLDEVGVYAYKLTTNRPKEMLPGKPRVPSDEEIEIKPMQMPLASSPVDLLYYYFGKRPKQLRELETLMQKDEFRRKLQGNNRKLLSDLTGLTPIEIEQLAFYCRYSPLTIQHATDYQLLQSILYCYDTFKRAQEVENILNEWD